MTAIEINVAEVVYREDLYPRLRTSAETVQKYAEDLSVLPPIEVNQHKELIDGWHRWTAHKKCEVPTIKAVVVETASDAHLLEMAIEKNATHGLQLSQADKKDMARRIYHATPERDRDDKKKQLAKILSVGERTVREWLSRIDKDAKEERNRRIFDLWMGCWTQEEIASREGVTKETVSEVCQKMADLPKPDRSAADHATDFDPPIYNVWKQQERTPGTSHFGNSDVRWVDNLLYLYTKPFDVVVDPFAGGGSTIDICRKRFRRYFVSDRKPVVEREKEIRCHDLTAGIPKPPQWKDVALVYLDPPYWKQAEGKYSSDPTDLANMEADQFHDELAKIINGFAGKLPAGAHIALIIQPTQWKAPDRQFTDHVSEMIRRVKQPIAMRIQAPYESQQCTAQMVEWAKENRQVLVLSREIVVWRVAK
jgi:hypothetical protein